MLDHPPFTYRVIDLKQYAYCPRVFFYQTILPQVRPTTYKMDAGIQAHHQAEAKEKRRQLRTYGLSGGQRYFNVPLYAPALNLSGELDMLIETDDELIPVDYKFSRKAGAHFKLQLMAYAQMLRESDAVTSIRRRSGKTIKRGFLYLIPNRQVVEVKFTAHWQNKLQQSLMTMQKIVKTQQMPAATTYQRRCIDCEFRRFCNDV